MSQGEFSAMRTSGKVQESFSGTTHVANPADASAFINQAKPGSLYIEFNVPASSLKTTNEGWSKVIGPNSLEGRLAVRNGQPIPQMPEATSIVHSTTKLPRVNSLCWTNLSIGQSVRRKPTGVPPFCGDSTE
jgi:hypothetical protein